MKHSRVQILDVPVSVVSPERAYEIIYSMIRERRKGFVCVAPVSTVMTAQDDAAYKEIIQKASMVTPDGMPLVWIARWLGHKTIERTYGPDLMHEVCKKGIAHGLRHFLFGGTPEVNRQLKTTLEERYPGIVIAGAFSPPFSEQVHIDSRLADEINRASADILWVGLGSPKQDFWMYKNRDILDAPVMVGVGAAFDFVAGVKPQAPLWVQRSGLEWLFRLACEPRRLWKRYVIGNSRFIYLILKSYMKGDFKKYER